MESEKQNDVVEDLEVKNQSAAVVEEQPEVVLEPASIDNNIGVAADEDNNVEGETSANNEVILEPIPSQAEVFLGQTSVTNTESVVEDVDSAITASGTTNSVLVETNDSVLSVDGGDTVNPEPVLDANVDVPNVNANTDAVANVGVENVMSNTNQIDSSVDTKQPKKKKTGLIIGILVGLVALAVVILFVVRSIMNKPYNIFNALVDEGYTEISNILKEADKRSIKYNFEDSIVVSGNVKLDSSLSDLISYFDYDYDYKLGLDPKAEKVELGLSMNKDGQVTIGGFLYVIKNMMYIKSDKAYDKVLYSENEKSIFADVDFSDLKIDYNVDDINRLIELYLGYVKEAVKEDKFTTEKGTVKYQNKDLEVNKIKYELNSDEQYEFANSVYESMKNDGEFKKLVMKIMGYTADEYSEQLKYMKPDKEEYEDEKTVAYYIYTKGFFSSVVGVGMSDGELVENCIFVDEKGEFTAINENSSFKANINGDTIDGIAEAGKISLKFKAVIKETEKGSNIVLEATLDEDGNEGEFKIEIDTEKVNDKKITSKLNFEVSATAEGESQSFDLELTNSVLIGEKVANEDFNGAVSIDTLTDADYQTIYNNIKTASVGSPLELVFLLIESFGNTDYSEPVVSYDVNELIIG